MNKKLYKFISKKEYERMQSLRKIYEYRKKPIPLAYTYVYKQAEDGSYYRPKPLKYETVVQMLIREKYSEHDEFAIQRKRDTKPNEFQEYYDYVESCIAQAKAFIEERENWDSEVNNNGLS